MVKNGAMEEPAYSDMIVRYQFWKLMYKACTKFGSADTCIVHEHQQFLRLMLDNAQVALEILQHVECMNWDNYLTKEVCMK